MEERNLKVREGLNTMYQSNVIAAACLVLAFIPLINIAAVIGAVVAAVMSFVAILKLRGTHDDYNTVFTLVILNVVITIAGSLVGDNIESFVDIVGSVVGLAQTYFMIRATNSLLQEQGRPEVVEQGQKTLKIYFITFVLGIATSLVSLVLAVVDSGAALALALVVLIASLIISIVGMVYYIKYLGVARDCF